MKKDYWVSRQNTPKLDLYTKILGTIYFFLGINCFCTYFFMDNSVLKESAGWAICDIGIVMFVLIYPITTDKRRVERNLGAVVRHSILHGFVTLGLAASIHSWRLLVVYVVEMLYIIFQIRIYNKKHFC